MAQKLKYINGYTLKKLTPIPFSCAPFCFQSPIGNHFYYLFLYILPGFLYASTCVCVYIFLFILLLIQKVAYYIHYSAFGFFYLTNVSWQSFHAAIQLPLLFLFFSQMPSNLLCGHIMDSLIILYRRPGCFQTLSIINKAAGELPCICIISCVCWYICRPNSQKQECQVRG